MNRDDQEVRVKLGCMRSDSFMGRILWVAGVLFCCVHVMWETAIIHQFCLLLIDLTKTNFCLKDLIDDFIEVCVQRPDPPFLI